MTQQNNNQQPNYQQQPYPQPPHQQQPREVIYVQGPASAVTKQKAKTSHTFHLLMTLFTCGAWGIFVWIPIIIWHAIGPKEKVKTQYR